jgi:hypothetical protein
VHAAASPVYEPKASDPLVALLDHLMQAKHVAASRSQGACSRASRRRLRHRLKHNR